MHLKPGESDELLLNLTVPFLCQRLPLCQMRVELYFQNNYKPMCNYSEIIGNGDMTNTLCFAAVEGIRPPFIMHEQYARFNITAATTSLYTGRNYMITANFKVPPRLRHHKMWRNYTPPPLKVIFLAPVIVSQLCLALISCGTILLVPKPIMHFALTLQKYSQTS